MLRPGGQGKITNYGDSPSEELETALDLKDGEIAAMQDMASSRRERAQESRTATGSTPLSASFWTAGAGPQSMGIC